MTTTMTTTAITNCYGEVAAQGTATVGQTVALTRMTRGGRISEDRVVAEVIRVTETGQTIVRLVDVAVVAPAPRPSRKPARRSKSPARGVSISTLRADRARDARIDSGTHHWGDDD